MRYIVHKLYNNIGVGDSLGFIIDKVLRDLVYGYNIERIEGIVLAYMEV